MSPLTPIDTAFARLSALITPLSTKTVPLETADGRVLAQSAMAKRAQPPFSMSAMDGYAVAGEFERYQVIGEIKAGDWPDIRLQDGQAVRIFTGGVMPEGADRVVIQENVTRKDDFIHAAPIPSLAENIRSKGADFDIGERVDAPRRLLAHDIALLAAMNYGAVDVYRAPSVRIFGTGDELVLAGSAQSPREIIASNLYALSALAKTYGGVPVIAPILPDDQRAIEDAFQNADEDIILTTGGASVGDYDYVQDAARAAGIEFDTIKIALRPGKPVMFGKRNHQLFLGLPGNPVSAIITARLFLRLALEKMQNLPNFWEEQTYAVLDGALPKNQDRLHLIRATISQKGTETYAKPFSNFDSAALSVLTKANGLILQDPFDEGKTAGDRVRVLRFS